RGRRRYEQQTRKQPDDANQIPDLEQAGGECDAAGQEQNGWQSKYQFCQIRRAAQQEDAKYQNGRDKPRLSKRGPPQTRTRCSGAEEQVEFATSSRAK